MSTLMLFATMTVQTDWSVIGADLITKLTPVLVVAVVYWFKGFVPTLSPIATNILALVLTAAANVIATVLQDGVWNPVQSALLMAVATLIANLIQNLGAEPAVKKLLLVKGSGERR